jgi:hypothetical protein
MAFIPFAFALLFIGITESHAQAVSIVNMDKSREALLVEAGLKHILRNQGYSVKGPGTEGFVILLHGMSAHSTQGATIGVVGSAVITKVLRKESASHLLSGHREIPERDFIEKFTTVMGSPVVYLAGTTAIGGSAEAVAEILSVYIDNALRGRLLRGSELIRTIENGAYDSPLR